jgi:hypothetical protein
MASSEDPMVRLTITNETDGHVRLVLEPLGEIHALAPQASRTVKYWDDPVEHVSVDIRDGELKLWPRTKGSLEFEDSRTEDP